MPCQVPSASRPSCSGTSTCGPISEARMWDGAFSSPSSMCCQCQSSPTMRSSAASKSRATAGSACSLMVTPAVVCGTKINAAVAPFAPFSDSRTLPVMSSNWVRRSVRTRISCIGHILSAMAAATPRELDSYRERIDRFIADLDQEYYDHFAGLKEDFDLESIYGEYEDVTSLERARRMEEERSAELEATLKATVDGEEIPFRMLRPTIANSADRDRRERIERVRNELTDEHLNPLLLASHRETHEATKQLGAETYRALYDKFNYRLDDLAAQCRAFLDSTESLYEDAADRLLRAGAGVGLAEAQRWD